MCLCDRRKLAGFPAWHHPQLILALHVLEEGNDLADLRYGCRLKAGDVVILKNRRNSLWTTFLIFIADIIGGVCIASSYTIHSQRFKILNDVSFSKMRPPSPFDEFLRSREKDLRRIAYNTGGYMTIDDMQSEVWLAASNIGIKRGHPIDFSHCDDQEAILRKMYSQLVKYAEKHTRYAVRLDEGWNDEDSDAATNMLAHLLIAPPESDPQVWLQQREDTVELSELIRSSYSEACAYVLLLVRFDWDLGDVAAYLHIMIDTLRRRLTLSGVRARVQPSLFDRVEFIDPDFTPQQAFRYPEKIATEWASHQRYWIF